MSDLPQPRRVFLSGLTVLGGASLFPHLFDQTPLRRTERLLAADKPPDSRLLKYLIHRDSESSDTPLLDFWAHVSRSGLGVYGDHVLRSAHAVVLEDIRDLLYQCKSFGTTKITEGLCSKLRSSYKVNQGVVRGLPFMGSYGLAFALDYIFDFFSSRAYKAEFRSFMDRVMPGVNSEKEQILSLVDGSDVGTSATQGYLFLIFYMAFLLNDKRKVEEALSKAIQETVSAAHQKILRFESLEFHTPRTRIIDIATLIPPQVNQCQIQFEVRGLQSLIFDAAREGSRIVLSKNFKDTAQALQFALRYRDFCTRVGLASDSESFDLSSLDYKQITKVTIKNPVIS